MDQYEDIVERAAESIMQRVNDTWPRTLNKDVLRDEIGKAIREARKKFDWQNWPPKVSGYDPVPYGIVVAADPVTLSHNEPNDHPLHS